MKRSIARIRKPKPPERKAAGAPGPVEQNSAPERDGLYDLDVRPRLETREAVDAANADLLEKVLREKQDKNCWTAQAITSSAVDRARKLERYRGRKKGAVGPWRALANEYARSCENFDAFVQAIQHEKRVDDIDGEIIYSRTGKTITKKSLREHFDKARRESAKCG